MWPIFENRFPEPAAHHEARDHDLHASQTTPASPRNGGNMQSTVLLSIRARDILHEASLAGMHAIRYSRLSAVCNDWVYYV